MVIDDVLPPDDELELEDELDELLVDELELLELLDDELELLELDEELELPPLPPITKCCAETAGTV